MAERVKRQKLRAPFPWFGGKSRASHLVWAAFGDVANYVEPFAGSLAVLLGRPTEPRVETVNDLDCYLANFWRAVQAAPMEVARHADWPVNEADLISRHRWLVAQAEFREKMRRDPEFFDVRIAGWWVWGLSQWIGSGWCAQPAWEEQQAAGAVKTLGIHTAEYAKRPMLDKPGRGVHQLKVGKGEMRDLRSNPEYERRPRLSFPQGVQSAAAVRGRATSEFAARPDLVGRGIHGRARDLSGAAEWEKRPAMGRGGRGVQSVWEQIPDIGGSRGAAGRGVHATGLETEGIYAWMMALAARLRRVRVCCGDWSRVLGPSATTHIGVTGILLDPPYSAAAGRDPSIYSEESLDVAVQVREWAIAHGDDPKMRIALCGYEGEHEMPATWRCESWKAVGGYGSRKGQSKNALRERIWFSPACMDPSRGQRELFSEAG